MSCSLAIRRILPINVYVTLDLDYLYAYLLAQGSAFSS